MSLTVLFTLLFVLFIASRWAFSGWWGRVLNLRHPISAFEAPLPSKKAPARGSAQPHQILGFGGPLSLNTWMTRLFIAIVLQSAVLFLISQFPGIQSPFWLGVVLQGFTYGSATLFYASGGDETAGY